VTPLQGVTNRAAFLGIRDPVIGGPASVAVGTVDVLGPVFDYVGRVKRTTVYKDTGLNVNFQQFLKETGREIPLAFKYANANIDAEKPSVAKYGKTAPVFDNEALRFAVSCVRQHFRPSMGGALIMTTDEVIDELDLSTSPGYPVNLKYPTKRLFLEDPRARKYIDEFERQVTNCEMQWVPLWTSSVKAEIRPMEKLLANKLRTFCAGPIELTVLLNKYFFGHEYTIL
jgi:hypothetical protein